MEMKEVLLTGASSGIGKALAYQYAKEGYSLSLVARNEEELNKIKLDIEKEYKACVSLYPFDLTRDIKNLYEAILEDHKDISILINNAGMGYAGEFLNHTLSKEHDLIDLNIKAVMDLCYYFGNYFKEKGNGVILNISSVGAMMPGPFIASYYASKSFLSSFSLSLSYELKRNNILVHAFQLPRTNTAFDERAERKEGSLKKGKDPSVVAKKIFKLAKKKKCIINIGLSTKITNLLERILPRSLFLNFIGKSLGKSVV